MEPSRDGDALLVERVRAGDDRALAAIYDRHAGLVYGLARRVARDEQLAREVTREVFTDLWETPERIDLSRESLRAHLAQLAHRRVVDEVRRRRADPAWALPGPADGPETAVGESATQTFAKNQKSALELLPAEQRSAVRLAYYEGLTYVEVARALGIPEGTAKTRLRDALATLRTLLKEEGREEIT